MELLYGYYTICVFFTMYVRLQLSGKTMFRDCLLALALGWLIAPLYFFYSLFGKVNS